MLKDLAFLAAGAATGLTIARVTRIAAHVVRGRR